MSVIYAILAVMVAWFFVVPVGVLCALPVPSQAKRQALPSVLGAAVRNLVTMPFNLSAPLAIWLCIKADLLKWDYERIGNKDGLLDALWGSNWRWRRSDGVLVGGINGDSLEWEANADGQGEPKPYPLEDTPEARALNKYWTDMHGRSDTFRFRWLGLRNRATRLTQLLGKHITAGAYEESYGQPDNSRSQPGWGLARAGNVWQLSASVKVGKWVLRTHGGYKLRNAFFEHMKIASPSTIALAVQRHKPPAEAVF